MGPNACEGGCQRDHMQIAAPAHTHTHAHTYTCPCMHIHVHAHKNAQTRAQYAHTHTRTHVHTCTHTHARTHQHCLRGEEYGRSGSRKSTHGESRMTAVALCALVAPMSAITLQTSTSQRHCSAHRQSWCSANEKGRRQNAVRHEVVKHSYALAPRSTLARSGTQQHIQPARRFMIRSAKPAIRPPARGCAGVAVSASVVGLPQVHNSNSVTA